MATMWRKAMLYLGLGPDDEYEDYDAAIPEERPVAPREQPAPAPPGPGALPSRPVPPARGRPRQGPGRPPRRRPRRRRSRPRRPSPTSRLPCAPLPVQGDEAPKPRVRAVPRIPKKQPHMVDADLLQPGPGGRRQVQGDQPVAMDLVDADRELSRRLIDFSSGLCYGLGGHMEKVANHLYLLTPADVEVTADERRKLADRSFADV